MNYLRAERALKIMKISLFLPLLFIFIFAACKTKQTAAKFSLKNPIQTASLPIASGKVSHQYSSTGCGTVILCDKINGKDSIVFIPITGIKGFDIDGLEISFNYRILKIRNPKGCLTGTPIQLTNVSKK